MVPHGTQRIPRLHSQAFSAARGLEVGAEICVEEEVNMQVHCCSSWVAMPSRIHDRPLRRVFFTTESPQREPTAAPAMRLQHRASDAVATSEMCVHAQPWVDIV